MICQAAACRDRDERRRKRRESLVGAAGVLVILLLMGLAGWIEQVPVQ